MRATPDRELSAVLAQHYETPSIRARTSSVRVPDTQYVPRWLARKGDQATKCAYVAGRWAAATFFNDSESIEFCDHHALGINAALQETGNEIGGFVVPEEFAAIVLTYLETFGVARREAEVIPMKSDTFRISARSGGPTAVYSGESQALAETLLNWKQFALTVKKLATLIKMSNEFYADALIPMADYIARLIAWAFSQSEDKAAYLGDGSGTYGGITGVVNAVGTGSVVSAASGHTGFESLTLTDFCDVIGRLPTYVQNPKWYISQAGYAAAFLRLTIAWAGGSKPADLEQGATEKRFLGYPIVITQALNNTLGTDPSQPKVIFGDMQMGTRFGVRDDLRIAVADQRYLETDEIGIRATERYDFVTVDPGTSTQAGSLIVLQSAAS